MKMLHGVFALLITLSLVGTAHARLVEVQDKTVEIATGSGKAPTLDEVKKSLRAAAISRGWAAFDKGPGKLKLDLNERKHELSVEVTFNTKSYTIKYLSSENLKFNQGKIHPKYNEWVGNLVKSANVEFSKL